MVKFLSKALSTLRKRGAKKPKRRRPAKRKKAGSPTATLEPDAAPESIQSLEDELVESPASASAGRAESVAPPVEAPETPGAPPMTAERRALIRQAMAVQRSKAKLLDELSPEQRRKLSVLARKALLGE
jgi:hypothetical protein